jgi:hypothetical protein
MPIQRRAVIDDWTTQKGGCRSASAHRQTQQTERRHEKVSLFHYRHREDFAMDRQLPRPTSRSPMSGLRRYAPDHVSLWGLRLAICQPFDLMSFLK